MTGIGVATGVPAVVTAAVMIGIATGAAGLVLRWSGRTRSWDDRHRLALIAGIIAFLLLINVGTLGGIGLVTAMLTTWALWWMYRRIRRSSDAEIPSMRSVVDEAPHSYVLPSRENERT